jgi:hypothetical protein
VTKTNSRTPKRDLGSEKTKFRSCKRDLGKQTVTNQAYKLKSTM